ncbi:MAG: hypothetical protein HY914_01030 [Desulfomonile tiedjei]|nr:hypothetical protein [Desulfomonile tiedjei]
MPDMSKLRRRNSGRLSRERAFPVSLLVLLAALFALVPVVVVWAAPIQEIRGTITEVGEGFLLLTPDGETATRKFVLRWKARFQPPKLPMPGDRALILFKDKPEGSVIYGVEYLKARTRSLGDPDLGGQDESAR